MVEVVAERGFRGASVALVAARAKVSNRTFYEQFNDLSECFGEVLDLGLTLPTELIVRAFAGAENWRDGVRAALVALLTFFDSEPALTRIWFGEVMTVGGWALEHRERNIAAVQALIVEHWFPDGRSQADPVLVRGVMSSVLGLLTTHVVTNQPESMMTLLGPLTSLTVTPFLDAEHARAEIDRAEALSRKLLSEDYLLPRASADSQLAAPGPQPPRGQKAQRCVLYLAEDPGASNSEIARGVGIAHSGQISTLLKRLEREGLLTKHAPGPGHPNAWRLTARGEQVARILRKRAVEPPQRSERLLPCYLDENASQCDCRSQYGKA
jgi:AcrR family transcriptional regulator/transposase-like protein